MTALLVLAAVAFIGGAFGLNFWLKSRQDAEEARWVPLGNTGLKYCPEQTLAAFLEAAFFDALAALETHTQTIPSQILRILQGWKIDVRPTRTWLNWRLQSVAGESYLDGYVIRVGSDYAALVHEIWHVCLYRSTGDEDAEHLTFEASGVNRAAEAYQAGLTN